MYDSYENSADSFYVEDYDMMVETETGTGVSVDGLLSNWFLWAG